MSFRNIVTTSFIYSPDILKNTRLIASLEGVCDKVYPTYDHFGRLLFISMLMKDLDDYATEHELIPEMIEFLPRVVPETISFAIAYENPDGKKLFSFEIKPKEADGQENQV